MILLHYINGKEIVIPIKYIQFIEQVEHGSIIECKDSSEYFSYEVKESPFEIHQKILLHKKF